MMEMLELDFWDSPTLQGENAAKNVVEAFSTVGATFVELDQDLRWHPISDLCALATAGLERFELKPKGFDEEIVSGTLIPDLGYLSLVVDASYENQAINEKHAHSLLRLAEMLYPVLLPVRGWVDLMADNRSVEKEITARRFQHLMWANFYGQEYIEKFGLDFLTNAPGWIAKELPMRGMMYVISPSYANKTKLFSKQTFRQYFNSDAKIKFY